MKTALAIGAGVLALYVLYRLATPAATLPRAMPTALRDLGSVLPPAPSVPPDWYRMTNDRGRETYYYNDGTVAVRGVG